ncbi:MAG: xanthine dehydrogenase [Rhodospirillaceae bacterium]|nr:xanthine dehydrogenase [Rhodospirillaceae bacterium]|tara:strand:+ start:1044 stop:1385 length:342 start_codon:yes stop_codon:yes gene_type:complete
MTKTSEIAGTDNVLKTVVDWIDDGSKSAIATVVDTWGSSPRPVGSQLGINEKGEIIGSVSGGCIEGAVVKEALKVMDTGSPSLLEFGVSNEEAWEVGLACGGTVRVFIERVES